MRQLEIVQPGGIKKLSKLLKNYKEVKIFLVHGKLSYIKSGAASFFSTILQNYEVVEFEKSSSLPRFEEAEIGSYLFKNTNCNLILSIGGGSVIDTGKLIKFQILSDQSNKLAPSQIPLIAIPTTAGSGSEATHFAVVYIDDIKQSIASRDLLPNVAIVDSNLTSGLSKYQMAVSGIDAFAQGIESYWSINSTSESLIYSEEAIRLVWSNLLKAINTDSKACQKLTEGSFLAGKAINIAKTSAPHALSYGFTSLLGIPHGHSVSLFLPFFIQYHAVLGKYNCVDKRGPEYVKEKIKIIASILNTDVDKVDVVMTKFISSIGLETKFNQLNISLKTYNEIINNVNIERLRNNPGVINNEVLQRIYTYNNLER